MAASRRFRSDDDWMELIIQSRRSGFTDAEWCRDHEIPLSSFYNAVSRLRRKACSIPDPSGSRHGKTLDLTAGSPDVVPVLIERRPEETPAVPGNDTYIDNSHMVEILMGNTRIRIRNGADPLLLKAVITAVGRDSC